MLFRETFLQIQMRLHQHLITKNCIAGIHQSKSRSIRPQWRKVKRQEQNQDQRCQSREDFQRTMGQTNNDCRFRIFTLTTPATFACWKIRFRTEVCTCSQFPTEAMQWIKVVEMADSVDDLNLHHQYGVFQCRIFEVLDARIASALNKIIHNSHFRRRISLEEQKGPERRPFPLWQADCLLDLRLLPVTGAHDSVENYADLFTISLRNDDIQQFDSK